MQGPMSYIVISAAQNLSRKLLRRCQKKKKKTGKRGQTLSPKRCLNDLALSLTEQVADKVNAFVPLDQYAFWTRENADNRAKHLACLLQNVTKVLNTNLSQSFAC